jgi:hypothetical protein
MNKKILIISSIVAASVIFSGCATVLGGGSSQTLSINSSSNVKGTMKYSDGSGTQYFTTPATLIVDRKSKSIILTSDNDEFHTTTVSSDLNLWFLGNIMGGAATFFSTTTDLASGSAWKYDETVTISQK